MADNEEKKDDIRAEESQEEAPKKLSSDFFHDLLKTPPCKTGGTCNNCGRCEH